MKGTLFLTLLVLSLFVVGFASVVVKPAAAENPIIVGKWDRTDGYDKYTIFADHTTQTILPEGTYYGTWEYEGSSGYKYIFYWEHGPPGKTPFIDYVTVAPDGQSYSGYNNYGNHFNCVQVSNEPGSNPTAESGEFPILYVAAGAGVAAAAVGAAVYYFFIAGGHAAAAGAPASGAGSGAVSEGKQLAENDTLKVDEEKREEIDKIKTELQNLQESLKPTVKQPADGVTVTKIKEKPELPTAEAGSPEPANPTPHSSNGIFDVEVPEVLRNAYEQLKMSPKDVPELVRNFFEQMKMTPEQQADWLLKTKGKILPPEFPASPPPQGVVGDASSGGDGSITS